MATQDKSTSTGTGSGTASGISVSGVVADGHTVVGDDGTTYGPGETVAMRSDEIERLRTLGFLKDEEAEDADAAPSRADAGPTVKSDGGPTVKGKG
jgi:hypothetical protein